MKWLKLVTGVADNIKRMFEQVDRLHQKTNTKLYNVKITFDNQIYTVKVFDGEGNSVDGAIVLLYPYEQGTMPIDGTSGVIDVPSSSHPWVIYNPAIIRQGSWNAAIARIPSAGSIFVIRDNPRATLKACVLGIEQGV